MIRTELINYLFRLRGFTRYLEITVHDEQNNFAYVDCKNKVTTIGGTSDNFFEGNCEEFDIIFVDGVHTEEQALKDIRNSQRCLAKGGIIIIHDCMPPDEWHQREPEEFHEGENWNGTVWKAALRIFNESEFRCYLLDTDWGCGIIDTSKTQVPQNLSLPVKLEYNLHFPWLLKYRKSISSFLRDDIKIFYHLACMGNWKDVFREQLVQLDRNGFSQIDMTVLGTDEDLQTVNSACDEMDFKMQIISKAPELTQFEKPALLAIEQYARQNEGYVLYLHSKGVSSPSDETKMKWRRLMMRELVENWEFCMLQLTRYDVIGVNWRDMYPTSHFCGNFWYASTGYLRKLMDFTQYYENPRYNIWDAVHDKRLGCEFWISSSREKPKVLSLFCNNVDFCNRTFWRNR